MVQYRSRVHEYGMKLYKFDSTKKSAAWKIWRRLKNKCFSFNFLTILVFVIFKCYRIFKSLFTEKSKDDPICKDRMINKTSKIPDLESSEAIRPFTIDVPDRVLDDLRTRLERTRFEEPSNDLQIKNGLNRVQTIVKYWRTQYEWRKYEEELNKYPQFKTKIEDLDVHFVHVTPVVDNKRKMKVFPLLLIHGWPGSLETFHQYIPLLTDADQDFVFEVVCPSLPGFGFSDAPLYEDFNGKDASRILLTLMSRLGFSQFYVLGYGWGAVVASLLARFYPFRVKGVHVNMCFSLPKSFDSFVKLALLTAFPFLVSPAERRTLFPLRKKMSRLWEETADYHMQACAILDSPAGMAAFFLEKFSTKNRGNLIQPGSEMLKTTHLDELLTVVTICWINNNFSSGARFYKENIKDVILSAHERVPLTVPVGVAVFPNEVLMLPKWIIEAEMEDLVTYSIMPAEEQEHHSLVKDLRQFVQTVEGRALNFEYAADTDHS